MHIPQKLKEQILEKDLPLLKKRYHNFWTGSISTWGRTAETDYFNGNWKTK